MKKTFMERINEIRQNTRNVPLRTREWEENHPNLFKESRQSEKKSSKKV